MDYSKEIAVTILEQLGGKRFLLFTGAKNLTATGNGLLFKIPRNASKANHCKITLNGSDLYDVEFFQFIPGKLKIDHKKGTAEWVDEKRTTVKTFNDCYFDMLQDLFTEVTGLYTHF